MLIKIHKTYRDIVAICDTELLGKYFEEGNFQLDVKESFFAGKEVSEAELLQMIKKESMEDATFNIIGEKSVSCALKAGIILKSGVKIIQGIPYAVVLL